MLLNSQTPKIFRVHWDKTLKITGIRHGLVMISNTAIYLLWVTGPTGRVTLSLTKVFQGTSGASVNATYSEAEDLVTITTSANCAITFIGK